MSKPLSLPTLLDPIEIDLKVAKGAVRRLAGDACTGSSAVQDVVRNSLRQLRTDVKIAESEFDAAMAYDRNAYLAAVREIVDGWRARLNELRVQIALAGMDTRDDVQEALATGEEAISVARKHLAEAGADAAATLDAVRAGVEESRHSLVTAGRAAIAVVERHLREAGSMP